MPPAVKSSEVGATEKNQSVAARRSRLREQHVNPHLNIQAILLGSYFKILCVVEAKSYVT